MPQPAPPFPFPHWPDGSALPRLGLGTWRLGESAGSRAGDVAAVRTAIDVGYRLIDTAEMYGEGGAEQVVGQAVAEALRAGTVRREELVIVSKVYPHNASRRGTRAACERSRARLGLDHVDLYLLHWRGQHPLHDTVEAMHGLVADGLIGHWGVSNFDTDDMAELDAVVRAAGAGAPPCATDQVYLSPSERGPEFRLLPWLRAHGQTLMAYSPIDQGAIGRDPTLAAIGAARGLSAAQVALAWLCGLPGVLPIPKARSEAHLRQNLAAAEVALTVAERAQIDAAFPPPKRATPLAMV